MWLELRVISSRSIRGPKLAGQSPDDLTSKPCCGIASCFLGLQQNEQGQRVQRCIVCRVGYDESLQHSTRLVFRPAQCQCWRAPATCLNIFDVQATLVLLLRIQCPLESGLEPGPLHSLLESTVQRPCRLVLPSCFCSPTTGPTTLHRCDLRSEDGRKGVSLAKRDATGNRTPTVCEGLPSPKW